jgi:hypothetical protein
MLDNKRPFYTVEEVRVHDRTLPCSRATDRKIVDE